MPKHEPAYFDSQTVAAAALKIDIYRLRRPKEKAARHFIARSIAPNFLKPIRILRSAVTTAILPWYMWK
jgi:hypothetical protein